MMLPSSVQVELENTILALREQTRLLHVGLAAAPEILPPPSACISRGCFQRGELIRRVLVHPYPQIHHHGAA